MRRGRRLTWFIFALCALLVVDVLGWMTVQTLRLERREREASQQAELKELVRRVLWDMESLVIPILTTESARPYFHYRAFYPAERAYTRMFEELDADEVLQPSPLLTEDAPFVRLHYEIDANGEVHSPQVPVGDLQDLAEGRDLRSGEEIALSRLRLGEVEDMLASERLAAGEPAEPAGEGAQVSMGTELQKESGEAVLKQIGESLNQGDFEARQQVLDQAANRKYQIFEGQTAERLAIGSPRQEAAQEDVLHTRRLESDADRRADRDLPAPAAPELRENLRVEPVEGAVLGRVALGASPPPAEFEAIWRRDPASGSPELFFEREIELAGATRTQGFWIDWPALRAAMLNAVVKPRPDVASTIAGEFRADLIPMQTDAPSGAALRLASVPVRLVPTIFPSAPRDALTPIRVTLVVTWLATLVAIGSIAVVLRAAMALSERRGRFVSAVTHELRTPMTTFRMYSEMLAGGMVADEQKRQRYLATLRDEAGRLSRIVESVLAYARLDKARRRETSFEPAGEILDRAIPALGQIAERAGVELEFDIAEDAREAFIPGDTEAIERICCNLVDNAGKYGKDAEPRVRFSAELASGQLRLRVRDFGRGIPWSERTRIFTAFDRAAHEGDSQNPGLGLGLALSRGLARELGGDLVLVRHTGPGALFELRLPARR